MVEVVAEGVPAGLGAPVYGKLDADLAAALMSINAVKGVEIGAGSPSAALSGEENADEMRMDATAGDLRLQSRRRNFGRHRDGPADCGAFRGKTDLFDPQPPPHRGCAGP